jgi:hypothetical protein
MLGCSIAGLLFHLFRILFSCVFIISTASDCSNSTLVWDIPFPTGHLDSPAKPHSYTLNADTFTLSETQQQQPKTYAHTDERQQAFSTSSTPKYFINFPSRSAAWYLAISLAILIGDNTLAVRFSQVQVDLLQRAQEEVSGTGASLHA